jgi:hypothetical protein
MHGDLETAYVESEKSALETSSPIRLQLEQIRFEAEVRFELQLCHSESFQDYRNILETEISENKINLEKMRSNKKLSKSRDRKILRARIHALVQFSNLLEEILSKNISTITEHYYDTYIRLLEMVSD